MQLTESDVSQLGSFTSNQLALIGRQHKGTKARDLIGMDVSEHVFLHMVALRGLRIQMDSPRFAAMVRERDSTLRQFGFNSYADYLRSDEWKVIRNQVYSERGRTCLRCFDNPASCVHHENYARTVIMGKPKAIRAWLWPLCSDCHRLRHFDADKWRDRFTMGLIVSGSA